MFHNILVSYKAHVLRGFQGVSLYLVAFFIFMYTGLQKYNSTLLVPYQLSTYNCSHASSILAEPCIWLYVSLYGTVV
jgi:hypothetical protein